MKPDELRERLSEFQSDNKVTTKGKLATVLYISRIAKDEGLPLDPTSLRTKKRGQVRGLSKAAVQAVLQDHGIERVLAQEGGRTSRGSLGLMESYVSFLNDLHHARLADMEQIELYWVEQVQHYFASKPLILKYDTSKTIQALLTDLFKQVKKRQNENPGSTYLGTVLQHLVGAKLEVAIPELNLEHHGASVADDPLARGGDFSIDDIIIHVTTAPSSALIKKCRKNINAGLKPIIITLAERVKLAEGNADMAGIGDRVEVFGAEQFLATNLYELSGFQVNKRGESFQQLIERYNEIISKYETDPGLRIRLGS